MKKILSILSFAGLLFVSCNEEPPPVTFDFGLEENFQTSDIYISENSLLKFSITDIADSRCPSDVVCIWQGKADVKIEIESPQKGTIVLNGYDNLVDTFGIYSFELLDVSPFPISTETIKTEEYDVTLKIEKLSSDN